MFLLDLMLSICMCSWRVFISLCIDLLVWHTFRKAILNLVWIDEILRTTATRIILSTCLLETFQILLPWRNDRFLGICRANVVIVVSFCACNSVSSCSDCCTLVLVGHLELLRSLLILILENHLLHSLSVFVEWNLDTAVWIS